MSLLTLLAFTRARSTLSTRASCASSNARSKSSPYSGVLEVPPFDGVDFAVSVRESLFLWRGVGAAGCVTTSHGSLPRATRNRVLGGRHPDPAGLAVLVGLLHPQPTPSVRDGRRSNRIGGRDDGK